METTFWKKCSTCKKPLPFGEPYQACSVSTCTHSRTGLQFCSVSCWSAHVPILRHREAWAIEKMAPSVDEARKLEASSGAGSAGGNSASSSATAPSGSSTQASGEATAPRRIIPSSTPAPSANAALNPASSDDVLVVVSKLKAYIRERSDMSTSADVIDVLSKKLRKLADEAIVRARNDGRKTVMARDF